MTDLAPVRSTRLGSAALTLRLQGTSFADIADVCGLNDEDSAVRAVLEELAARADDPANTNSREMLRLEVTDQLRELMDSVLPKATDGDHPEHLPAIRTAVAVIDRFTRLHGLDAPTEIAIHTPTQTEIDQWVAHVTSHAMPQLEEADILDGDVIEDTDG